MATEPNEYDAKIEELLKQYHEQKSKRSSAVCPAGDELLDYIEGHLPEEKKRTIERHVVLCRACQRSVLYFKHPALEEPAPAPSWEEFRRRRPEARRPVHSRWTAWISGLGRRPIALKLSWSGGLLAALLALTLSLGLYPTPLSRLAYIDEAGVADARAARRSSGDPEADALKEHYRQGLEALWAAQLWKLSRVNETRVDEAIQHLEKAKRLAQATKNEAYAAECCFYLGKAYLKKKDPVAARRQLEEFLKIGGSNVRLMQKQEETEMILAALAKSL